MSEEKERKVSKISKHSARYSEKGDSFVELNVKRLEEKPKRNPGLEKKSSLPSKSGNYVYVNMGYDSSMDGRSGNSSINYIDSQQVTTSVVREQYWACSKWPKGQRVLAITVGILLGAVIGLAVTMALKIPKEDTIIGNLITRNTG